LRKTITKSQ